MDMRLTGLCNCFVMNVLSILMACGGGVGDEGKI